MVASQAVDVEQLVVASRSIHQGADPGENAIGILRTQHRYVGQLNADPGQGGIGGRVEQGLGAVDVDSHAVHKIELSPTRLPSDLRSGFGLNRELEIASGNHGFRGPLGQAGNRIHPIQELERSDRLLLAHREIQEAAAVEIGILQAIHITQKQTIEAIHGWILGADIRISARQVLLETGGGHARRRKPHTRHRAGRLAAGAHGVEHTGPAVVGISTEADQALAQGQGGLQDRLPLHAVAIPGIEVVGDLAGFGEEGLFGGRQLCKGRAGGKFLQRSCIFVEQAWIAGVQQQRCGHGHRLH